MKRVSSVVWSVAGAAMLATAALPSRASGQGCMPLKFLSPSFAGLQSAYLLPHQWRLSLSARRVTTDKFYSGTDVVPGPGGGPLFLKLNSLDLSATYGLSERWSVTATVPFDYSSASSIFADKNRHEISSGGVGDVNLVANAWVLDPGSHVGGNIYVGLGAKAPIGSYHSLANSWDSTGAVSQQPLMQTNQEGDGGWAILVEVQAYQRMGLASVYVSGQYSASLRQHTDVIRPGVGVPWAVPDVYSARAGLSVAALPQWGLAFSTGGRIDGTMSRDIFHAAGDFFRSAGYVMYIEPGFSLVQGRSQVSLTVPIRVHSNYLTTTTSTGPRPGMGGVNDYLIYATYSLRM